MSVILIILEKILVAPITVRAFHIDSKKWKKDWENLTDETSPLLFVESQSWKVDFEDIVKEKPLGRGQLLFFSISLSFNSKTLSLFF